MLSLGISPFSAVKFMTITGLSVFHLSWTVLNGQVATVPLYMMVATYFITSTEISSDADRTIDLEVQDTSGLH